MERIPLADILKECDKLFNSDRSAELGALLRAYRVKAQELGDRAGELSILNELMGYSELLCRTPWPAYEESALVADTVEYGIQINGKVRARIALPADMDKAAVEQAALSAEPVQPFLSGKTVRKVIVVKNIVNIVVG